MNILNVVIERADDNYAAYIKEVDGITATGASIAEIKEQLKEAIDVFVDACGELQCEVPEVLQGEYELEFHMDVQTFLQFYAKILTKSGLERITGINQKQLWHYSSGHRVPRIEQKEKIESAIHKMCMELLSIHL